SSPSSTSSADASGLTTTSPPADVTSALIQTVSDSALVPWTPRYFSCSAAASMSWSQVTGSSGSSPAASATDVRYQRSWVLAQNGTVTSSSFHVAPSSAPSTTSSLTWSATSAGIGARKPGSASSGTNGGSRLIRSIDRSRA